MNRMNNHWGARFVAVAAISLAMGATAQVQADTSIRNAWVARYATAPSGTSQSYTNMLNNCNLCHATGAGSNYNQYGWQIRLQIQGGAATNQALTNVEHMNADGAAGDNLAEIRASTQPGWTAGAVNTIYINNSGSTLTNQLPAGLINSTVRYDNCPGNIANAGASANAVDVDDLLAVINAWGSCPAPCPPSCAADIAPVAAGDCAVNVDDLLGVINAWGSCPQ